MGTAVFAGMIVASSVGVFLIPMLLAIGLLRWRYRLIDGHLQKLANDVGQLKRDGQLHTPKAIALTLLKVLPGAGHACQLEQPWLFDKFMIEFLEKNGLFPAGATALPALTV